MQLTVVLPNYNHGHLIHQRINNLAFQSRPPDEIIVVDDGSTDDSLERLRFFPNVKVIALGSNHGVIYAINQGIAVATGDVLACMSMDDEILPGFFEKSLAALSTFPAGLSCTQSIWRDAIRGTEFVVGKGAKGFLAGTSVNNYFISSNTVIFRKPFAYHRELYAQFADCELIYSVARERGVVVIPEPLAVLSIGSGYWTRNRNKIPGIAELAIQHNSFPLWLLGPEAFTVLAKQHRLTFKYLCHCVKILAYRNLPVSVLRFILGRMQ